MKTILAVSLMLVGSVAVAQNTPQQHAALQRRTAASFLTYAQNGRIEATTRGMVGSPGYRSDAVNVGGVPAYITAGDGAYTSGQTNEGAADAIFNQGVIERNTAESSYAGGNFQQAMLEFRTANVTLGQAIQRYGRANTHYAGADEWWKRAVRGY